MKKAITNQHAAALRLRITNLVKGELRGRDRDTALALLQADQDIIGHLKAYNRQARSKLTAATKRANEDRAFGYKQLANEQELKTQQAELVNMLVIALLAMDSQVADEVVYFTKTRLVDQLLVLHPGVANRLGRSNQEHMATAAEAAATIGK